MLETKIILTVVGETANETLAKIDEAQKWLSEKTKEVARTIYSLSPSEKRKFNSDPDEYILNLFSAEDIQKSVYACLNKKKRPFEIEYNTVKSKILMDVIHHEQIEAKYKNIHKTGATTY